MKKNKTKQKKLHANKQRANLFDWYQIGEVAKAYRYSYYKDTNVKLHALKLSAHTHNLQSSRCALHLANAKRRAWSFIGTSRIVSDDFDFSRKLRATWSNFQVFQMKYQGQQWRRRRHQHNNKRHKAKCREKWTRENLILISSKKM